MCIYILYYISCANLSTKGKKNFVTLLTLLPLPPFDFLLFMHYHQQHQQSPSCLTIQRISPTSCSWVNLQRLCSAWRRGMQGWHGCTKSSSTLTQDLVTLTADISLERVSQVAGSHPFLTLTGLAYNKPWLCPSFICTVLLYRYVIPMVLPGSRHKQSFLSFFFFSWIIFPPDQFCSPVPSAAAQTTLLV